MRIRGCLVSVVHDVWAMAMTVYLPLLIVHPEGSPPAAGPFGLALHSHVPFAAMDAAGGVLGGFLFYDLVHYIAHRVIYTKDLATPSPTTACSSACCGSTATRCGSTTRSPSCTRAS